MSREFSGLDQDRLLVWFDDAFAMLGVRADVAIHDLGFLEDVLYLEVRVDERDGRDEVTRIAERGAVEYRPTTRSKPINLVMTREVVEEVMNEPLSVIPGLEAILFETRARPGRLIFWVWTSGGIRDVDLGSGIHGMSQQFLEDLADGAAIDEGRREFAAWRSRRPGPESTR